MASEQFPNEGLAYLLGIVPKGGTSPANLYLGLFTSQTATTVLTVTQTLAANITEPGYTNYARVAVASSDWGSVLATDTIGTQTPVSSVTASQKSFAAAGSVQSSAINGFFLASALTGGVCVFASNFEDSTAIASLALGDIVRITPKFALGG